MRDEVDGIYAAASGQRLSNLLNPISCGIKHDHFCIGADPGYQRLAIRHSGVNENHLDCGLARIIGRKGLKKVL